MSKSTRKKAVVIPITREEMEKAMSTYREAKIAEQDITAGINLAVTEARKPFEESIAEVNRKIVESFETVMKWAEQNQGEFKEARSITTPSGKLGYRIGNYFVDAVEGRTQKSALEFLLERRWLKKKFVRTSHSLNKEALLNRREKLEKKPKFLAKIGLCFPREETFFVDADIETMETATKEKV